MSKDDMISFMTASGRKSVMRRSQVSPTVIYSALRSVISTSATGIASHDALIQMAGGTPEGIVAGIMIGFQKVIYITSNDKESSWMSLPSQASEYSNKVNYLSYTSPDPDDPERGFLAAEAVKLLIPYIRNFVMDNKDIMIPPPFPIDVPPLQTFTHIAVTGRVVARTMLVNQSCLCLHYRERVAQYGPQFWFIFTFVFSGKHVFAVPKHCKQYSTDNEPFNAT